VDRPARKKGEERNSCVLEKSSSHVPVLLSNADSIFGALDSRSVMSCDTWSFWDGLACWPRLVDAAMRRMEFRMDVLSIGAEAAEATWGSLSPLTAVAVVVVVGAASLANCASSNDLWKASSVA